MKVAAFLVALAAFAGAVSPAEGLGAPPEHRAEIVFENGGRIVSIEADGSERRILTRETARPRERSNPFGPIVPVYDSEPSISPDGQSLLFLRHRRETVKPYSGFFQVMVANRDGGDPRIVWTSGKSASIGNLAWAPDGHSVRFSRDVYDYDGGNERTITAFVSVGLDGTSVRTLFRSEIKSADFRNYENFLYFGYREFTVSPDDRQLLYVNGRRGANRLMVTDLATGQSRELIAGAADPAWSSDGSKIAFTGGFKADGSQCSGACSPSLMIADADGSDRRRLTADASNATNPAFSPDGNRIAFQSDRNFPQGSFANEIYSIATEGEPCLTWLTNGSPSSQDPTWAPEAGASSEPAGCGAGHRRPLVGLGPLPLRRKHGNPDLWAGPSVRGGLLTEVESLNIGERYKYEDCGFYEPKRCLRPFVIETASVCGSAAIQTIEFGRLGNYSELRGALFLPTGRPGRPRGSFLITGSSVVMIGESFFFGGRAGRIFGKADHRAVVRNLRPVTSGTKPSGKLPKAKLTRSSARAQKRLERIYERTGSVVETARILGEPPRWIRDGLRFGRQVEKLGPFGVIDCPRQK